METTLQYGGFRSSDFSFTPVYLPLYDSDRTQQSVRAGHAHIHRSDPENHQCPWPVSEVRQVPVDVEGLIGIAPQEPAVTDESRHQFRSRTNHRGTSRSDPEGRLMSGRELSADEITLPIKRTEGDTLEDISRPSGSERLVPLRFVRERSW